MAFCTNCGTELSGNEKFCCRCGVKVSLENQSPEFGRTDYLIDGKSVFRYSHGSYYSGNIEFEIFEKENEFVIFVKGNKLFVNALSFKLEPGEFVELLNIIAVCFDWEENYASYEVRDGYSWSIALDYGEYKFHSSGSESRPYNYKNVSSKIHNTVETWRRKRYPDDYFKMIPQV